VCKIVLLVPRFAAPNLATSTSSGVK
jgi:hypothetical protein